MSLEGLFGDGDNHIILKAVQGNHFGKKILSLQCTASQIIKFIEIDGTVQRALIDYHVAEIQKYIQYGMDGNNIYFPPIILSARGKGEYNDINNEYKLKFDERLALLDGQHRIKAFEIVMKRLEIRKDIESSKKLDYVKKFPFTLQIFLDISTKEEKQLFTDVNTKASKASNTILIMYKNNDLCGALVKDIAENHPTISEELFELRAKYTKTKIMTAATLYSLIITLNEKLLHTEMIKSKMTEKNYGEYRAKTIKFLELFSKAFPINLFRSESIIYLPKIILAIAYFVVTTLEKHPELSMEEIFERVITKVNWLNSNSEFIKVGLQFNEKTKRYTVSNGTRGMKMIVAYLENALEEVLVK